MYIVTQELTVQRNMLIETKGIKTSFVKKEIEKNEIDEKDYFSAVVDLINDIE